MIRINLLPHREERTKQRKKAFYGLLLLGAVSAVLVMVLAYGYIAKKISDQNERNNIIKAENDRLDVQIREVATLKQEIQALKARQQAVEDLQTDRNQPVYLMDELVRQTPEGIYLRSFKQDGQRIFLNGYAHSNERVAEYLRNLGNRSTWLERPDLVEIKAVLQGQARDYRKPYEFIVNVGVKRPGNNESPTAQTGDSRTPGAEARKP